MCRSPTCRARAEQLAEKQRRKTVNLNPEEIAAMLRQQEEDEERERIEAERKVALELAETDNADDEPDDDVLLPPNAVIDDENLHATLGLLPNLVRKGTSVRRAPTGSEAPQCHTCSALQAARRERWLRPVPLRTRALWWSEAFQAHRRCSGRNPRCAAVTCTRAHSRAGRRCRIQGQHRVALRAVQRDFGPAS